MNKSVYLDLSIIEISKKQCIKQCKIILNGYRQFYYLYQNCEDVADHVENRFDRLNYEVNRSSPKRNYKKMIGLIKEEFKGKILTKFVALT